MVKNWIKLSRQIQNNWLWQDGQPFDRRSAWIDLLLLANHSDHDIMLNGQIIKAKRGQVNRSVTQLMSRWGWSKNRVLRFLKVLSDTNMITKESTRGGTIISIVNYSKYQGERTTNGTANDTADDTTDGLPTEPPTEHIQERKERKESIKNDLLSPEAREKWNELRKKARA